MKEAVIRRTITQEDMIRFAGLRAGRMGTSRRSSLGSHHTDPAVAKKAGLSGTVAQALHYCAYVSQVLLETYGQRWLEGAELEMKFVYPLYAGDTVEVRLTEDDSGRGKIECRNQDGRVIAFGSAQFGIDA